MPRTFLPTSDNGLLTFTANFSTLLVNNYAAYDIAQAVATEYAGTFETYQDALTASTAPETRGNATVLAKNTAKKLLIASTRAIARTIGNDMNITNAQRQALGLTIRKTPSPIPAPAVRPGVDLVSVDGRTVTVRIHNSAVVTKRGKPATILASSIYSFVGANYPSDPTTWTFQGQTTKDTFEIVFPESVAAGSQVWITATWLNAKTETGPLAVPISAFVQYGVSSSSKMKIAA